MRAHYARKCSTLSPPYQPSLTRGKGATTRRKGSDLDQVEIRLGRGAVRTAPRCGHIFPASSRRDTFFGHALRLVVNERTQHAAPGLECALGIDVRFLDRGI